MEPKYPKFLCFLISILVLASTIHAQIVVTRGPYIQMVSQNSLFIRWRTNVPTDSRIDYGTIPTAQNSQVIIGTSTTEHEVQLSGLNADTKYYYSIGHSGNLLSVAPDQFFYTLSPSNTIRPYQFWVVGDCGTGDDNQRAVRDAYLNYMGNTRVDGMIMLGDNAYNSGTDNDFQGALFNNTYENIVSNTSMWPTPGNHDYYSGADATTQTGPYYDIFTLPSAGQLGGFPSGTEAYYSFNIGNIHFISIDSYDSGRDSTNAMGTWIKQDLLNNTQQWTVAYWHHPPYSKGNHDSDNPYSMDLELVEMREQIVPLIENGGVDLVLCGHSHSYERSYLMDGHYGSSTSYSSSFRLDQGSGDFITDCPYIKNTLSGESHQGTVYTVLGVSGKLSAPVPGWPHPVTYAATATHLGSMILTINDNRLDAKFITSSNTIYDQFTIIKNAGGTQVVNICAGDAIDLNPSYPNSEYVWTPGNIYSSTFNIYPLTNTTYFSSDPLNCIRDTFQINVIQPGSPGDTCDWGIGIPNYIHELNSIYPNPVQKNQPLHIMINSPGENIEMEWMEMNGRSLLTQILPPGVNTVTVPNQLQAGIYMIKIRSNDHFHVHQLMLVD
jgi:hypothetical protein